MVQIKKTLTKETHSKETRIKETQIKKILIANRGEIACRIIRTARKMGIKTVAVYSNADRLALHVRCADEAIYIGPSIASESYLSIDKIIKACEETGADAVHPGYGFLSENPAFARQLKQANILFIGPSPESMEAMGLKDAAKALMDKAGVPVTPGYHGEAQDVKTLVREARKIGYPVLIKAVAGGGGKGMRRVDRAEEFQDALESCQREAQSSFGDDRVLIEKYITRPRHIEVQIFGDQDGQVIHLFERDCSLQRRHQKVIEESPAPGLTEKVRKAMTDAAVKAAQAVQYVGAGTVEFIVDGSGPLKADGFWFMEMNTRLQVEHPVTEMVTGIDLVEWQIRVAQGEALPSQKEISLKGHAIEARLYAEDPEADFMPSVGRLGILTLPGIGRVDTGVEQGGEVSLFYDPMISKLIAWGENREAAIETLKSMCDMTEVYPIKTNCRFLSQCLGHKAFIAAEVSTNFIDDFKDDLFTASMGHDDLQQIAELIRPDGEDGLFEARDGWRLNGPSREKFYKVINGKVTALPLMGQDVPISLYATCHDHSDGQIIFIRGQAYLIQSRMSGAISALISHSITAPMSGKIITVNVAQGESVKAGDPLIIMEAMKMEMALEAPRDGIVERVAVEAGTLVADGDIIVKMEQ